MIVLFGKTCSGKDTIMKYLVEHYGYKKLVTYTTRPCAKVRRQVWIITSSHRKNLWRR